MSDLTSVSKKYYFDIPGSMKTCVQRCEVFAASEKEAARKFANGEINNTELISGDFEQDDHITEHNALDFLEEIVDE